MNIHADFIEGCKKDSYQWYFEEYEKEETYFDKIADEATTDAAYEKGTVLTGPGLLDEKAYGEEYNTIGLAEAYIWYCKMREYGNLLPIEGSTLEDLKRRAGDLIRKWATEWAVAARNTKETLVANMFNFGAYDAGVHAIFDQSLSGGVLTDPSGDGAFTGTAASVMSWLTDTDDKWTDPNGDTYYNHHETLLPSPENLKTAYELLTRTNAKTESGAVAVIRPNLLLCANSTDALLWKQILMSDKMAGTNFNDINVLKGLVGGIVANPFIDSAAATARAWAIMQAKKSIRLYHRIEPDIDYFQDMKTNTFYGRIRMRIGCNVISVKHTVGAEWPNS